MTHSTNFGGIFVEWAREFIGERYPAGLPEVVTITTTEAIELERKGGIFSDEWENKTTVVLRVRGTNYKRRFHGTATDMMVAIADWDDKRKGVIR